MNRVIGIAAHVDSGKTTLSEQLLYAGGIIREKGRVDNKNSFLDYNEIERARGITVFADEAGFSVNDTNFYIIDTPGHSDFLGETERALSVCDAAVLVISAVEGIGGATEILWNLLKKYQIPTFIFLNKIDRDTANPQRVIDHIHNRWQVPAFIFTDNFSDYSEELALCCDELMEMYLIETEASTFLKKAGELFYKRKFFPIIKGSALKGDGVSTLISALDIFNLREPPKNQELLCTCYKVRHDAKGERITFLKINSGTLNPKDEVGYIDGSDIIKQKIHEMRSYSGAKFTPLAKAEAGTLCGVCGLKDIMPGDGVGFSPHKSKGFLLRPLMTVSVTGNESTSPKEIFKALKMLEDEEPLLKVTIDRFEKIHIETMGSIQQEILKSEIKTRFAMEVSFGKQQVKLLETIKAPVIGNAHYEPLRHYSELKLLLTPTECGSGITFSSQCSGDDFSLNWQRLVKSHVFEKEHLGVLTGSPLTDVHISLLAGRAHIEHTAGGDFRECVYRGIRQGLMKAENILLEPIVKFQIFVPQSLSGRVLNDITSMEGSANLIETKDENTFIEGTSPARTISDYAEKLLSFTKGCGTLNMEFSHYAPMKNQELEILNRGYSPESDLENSPDSIFCVHGTALAVRWFEADGHMHIK